MEQLHSTIGDVARQMLQNFTQRDRNDGYKFWDLREEVDWQHNLVLNAYGERMLNPEAYSAVFKILLEIYLAENKEQAEDFLYDIDPYANVSDLTAWLHSADENLAYVTKVLQRENPGSGPELLAKAHKLYLHDIGSNLIEAIYGHVLQNGYREKALH